MRAIETLITIYMMEEGFIAPTLNLENIDERCAMINHTRELSRIRYSYRSHPELCLWRSEYLPDYKKDIGSLYYGFRVIRGSEIKGCT